MPPTGNHEPDLRPALRRAGLISGPAAKLVPLGGGVSSDIFVVEDGARRFVVKRALAKLRVRDDWFADVGRNQVEQAFFQYAAGVVPAAVPRILHGDPVEGWFAMEYLGGEFHDWKSDLLGGRAAAAVARTAGETLGRLHAASWGDPVARAGFVTDENFAALRIAPYLRKSAERVPELRALLLAEADRLGQTHLALVHGDYSPKNLLIAPGRLVILDAEVAWFGDPAFDAAFLLNHLYLKSLYHASAPAPFLALVPAAWQAYVTALGEHADRSLEARVARLVLCLMLARIKGSSPVEYLRDPVQVQCVLDFVGRQLPAPPATMAALTAAWAADLARFLP